ncbi:MAG: hypothetical protein WCL51_13510 [Bacteroidota bacterium]
MNIFKLILDILRWFFSGVGVKILEYLGIFNSGKNHDSDFITVTIPPQPLYGHICENNMVINKKEIKSVEDAPYNEKFRTNIIMKDNSRYSVVETQEQILKKL